MSAVIAVLLTVLGVVIGVLRFHDAMNAVDTDNQFADGGSLTLHLEAGSDKAIWIMERGPSPDQKCGITGPGDPGLSDPGIDVFLARDAAWNPLYTIDAPRAGDYKITCSSRGPSRYAIGDTGSLVALTGRLLIGALLCVFGITACVALVAVTAIRRDRHHTRLLAELSNSRSSDPTYRVAAPGPR
ncbi:hypothetical protein ACIBL6_13525 [Streptomyces sp. NPDC050400]|uniref:hypothetical protein n=1 Tax=Streptomyces sp. NPDC050400 TaxID=3365610 RepID=UPI0037B07C9C